MTANFLKFKKNPGALLAEMKQAAEKQSKKGGQSDSRFWKPTFDKEKEVGSAVIRFLPSVDEDMLPWVKIYFRQFKGPTGRWYIENDLSTINRSDDPVYDLSMRCYNSGIESDKKGSSFLKRKVKYISNVLVIKDPKNPSAEGKVFLYEYGQQIFDILQNARSPKFEDVKPVEAFDPFYGANFNVRIVGKTVGTDVVPNYEQSFFSEPSALAASDEEVVKVCEKGISLKEFIAPDKFKDPEELKRKLYEVLGDRILSGIETIVGWSKDSVSEPVKEPSKEVAKEKTPVSDPEVDFNEDVPWDDTPEPSPSPSKEAVMTSPSEDEDVEAFMQNLLNS
jgi:hypothetical protein